MANFCQTLVILQSMNKYKPEKELVKACLKGDINSQKCLYNRFASKMMGVCWRYAKTRSEAEDLLQDGFMRVFMDLDQFKGKGSLEGWIRQVIVNVALQHLRKRKLVFAPMLEIERKSMVDNSYEQMFLNFEVQEILKMMNILPPGARVIFNLYVFEELTHKEIAEKLNITVSTSKSQLFKARNLLKAKFKSKKIVNDK